MTANNTCANNMNTSLPDADQLQRICARSNVSHDHAALLRNLGQAFPSLAFEHVLARGGWHRPGGVVTGDGRRISDNLREWVETESAGDVYGLIDRYANSGYYTTRTHGSTHYLVAQTGETAQDFVQLEIESLQEAMGPKLVNLEAPPDNTEDLIDPPDVEYSRDEPLGEPYYVYRRITSIGDYMQAVSRRLLELGKKTSPVERFMQDWDRSSSKDAGGPFCHHWVLSIQQYTDAWGENVVRAKPVSTYTNALPRMKLNGVHRGSELANLVHGIDHDIGYPMAWYFFMLSRTEIPHQLAEAIHNDLMGAYDYLPARDLKVLKDWSQQPYAI